jgi:hypothetical protein
MANVGSSFVFGKSYVAVNVNSSSEEEAIMLFEDVAEVLTRLQAKYQTGSEK